MNKLRRIIKRVNQYVYLITKKPEIIKKYFDFYYEDFSLLMEEIDNYSNKELSLFRYWCGVNANSFDYSGTNVISTVKKHIIMKVAGFHMNRLSYNLSMLDILSNNIDVISTRLNQFKTFRDLE